jgi:hypothetical protein
MNNPHLYGYAATNVSVNQSQMRADEIFLPADRILVHWNISRHLGRVATIVTVGARRLTVRFNDNQPGSFVDYKVALLLPPRGTTSYASNKYDILWTDSEGNITRLEHIRILDHFTRALGAAIAQEHDDEMATESHIDRFLFKLRCAISTHAEDRRARETLVRDAQEELERG